MRKIILVAALSALAATPALADFGDMIRSWSTPTLRVCWGIAWDGEYIWCNVGRTTGSTNFIYRCLPSNGSVLSSFKTVFNDRISGHGICYRLWGSRPVLDVDVWDKYAEENYIYRCYLNGSVADRIGVRLPGGAGTSGICFDGSNDWVSSRSTTGGKAFKLNDQGSPIASFTLNRAGDVGGITKQDDFFWFTVFSL